MGVEYPTNQTFSSTASATAIGTNPTTNLIEQLIEWMDRMGLRLLQS